MHELRECLEHREIRGLANHARGSRGSESVDDTLPALAAENHNGRRRMLERGVESNEAADCREAVLGAAALRCHRRGKARACVCVRESPARENDTE